MSPRILLKLWDLNYWLDIVSCLGIVNVNIIWRKWDRPYHLLLRKGKGISIISVLSGKREEEGDWEKRKGWEGGPALPTTCWCWLVRGPRLPVCQSWRRCLSARGNLASWRRWGRWEESWCWRDRQSHWGFWWGGISFIVVVRFYYNVFQTINIVELKGIISTIVIWKSNRLLKCKT